MRASGRQLYIYVAGAYTAHTPEEMAANTARAASVAQELMALGHIPFCPHSHTHGWQCDGRFGYEDFLRLGMRWLVKCDALFYIGPSPGADRELAVAKTLGLRIFRSLSEVWPVVEATPALGADTQ